MSVTYAGKLLDRRFEVFSGFGLDTEEEGCRSVVVEGFVAARDCFGFWAGDGKVEHIAGMIKI